MNIDSRIRSLPFSQQVALFVILRMPRSNESNFSFLSSYFAKTFKPYAKKHISTDVEEFGKFIGGILSGLARNNILIKLTGDRDKVWTLSQEVKNNYDNFKKSLFNIKSYWR